MYVNGKMRPAETIPGMGGWKVIEVLNSSMKYLI
jgi:hypothetical protein